MKSFRGQIKLIAEREIQLQLNYCKIQENFQKYFEGILKFSVFQILGFPNTPPPHDFSWKL